MIGSAFIVKKCSQLQKEISGVISWWWWCSMPFKKIMRNCSRHFASCMVIVLSPARPSLSGTNLLSATSLVYNTLIPGFIFVRTLFLSKRQMFIFSQTPSHAMTNSTRRHEYSRGISRTCHYPEFWCHFQKLLLEWKMVPLALGGGPQPFKKFTQKSECFCWESECDQWYQNSRTDKICTGIREYLWSSVAFVEAWNKLKFPMAQPA